MNVLLTFPRVVSTIDLLEFKIASKITLVTSVEDVSHYSMAIPIKTLLILGWIIYGIIINTQQKYDQHFHLKIEKIQVTKTITSWQDFKPNEDIVYKINPFNTVFALCPKEIQMNKNLSRHISLEEGPKKYRLNYK